MVDGVAHEVQQRGFDFVQQVAVNVRALPADLEGHFASEVAGRIAGGPAKRGGDGAERPHPAGQCLGVEPLGELGGVPLKTLEFGEARQHEPVARFDHRLQLAEGRGNIAAGRSGCDRAFQSSGRLALVAVETPELIRESPDAPRSDQRLSRASKQLVEALGGHAQRAGVIVRFRGRGGGFRGGDCSWFQGAFVLHC